MKYLWGRKLWKPACSIIITLSPAKMNIQEFHDSDIEEMIEI
ncbi:MAG: hypothetical protein Q4Q18_00200 [Methanobrevibacter sp.]|nr:hypothetical protein [Methanobrevibacter sp.]